MAGASGGDPFVALGSGPADLVIDTFGTFLGKRSERMIVRWREPVRPTVAAGNSPTDRADEPRGPAVLRFPRPGEPANGGGDAIAETGDCPPVGETDPVEAADFAPADAVAARLLSLWSRGRGRGRVGRRGDDERSADPATGSSEDRFRRLDASLRELDALVDETPGAAMQHREVPLDRLRSVIVAGRGISISSDLIDALVERGIALSFLSSRGAPVAHLTAPALAATVQTRRAQLEAYATRVGVELSAAFIEGKLRNQRHVLLYFGKHLKATDPARFQTVAAKAKSLGQLRRQLRALAAKPPRHRSALAPPIDALRDRMMGLEGTGARCYWEGVAAILGNRVEYPGRVTRGALDPVNAALNYGYGILYSQVFGAVVNAGLEPYAGFLHVDRPGKPSLVLDLVEEFRAPVVDRAIVAIVNQGIEIVTDEHGLGGPSKRLIAERVQERLNKPVPFEGKRHRLRSIVQMQARHVATAVRGERPYKPFCSRW